MSAPVEERPGDRLRPTRLAVGLGAGLVPLGLLASLVPAAAPVFLAAVAALLLLLGVEALLLRRQSSPRVGRILPAALALGGLVAYRLRVENHGRRPLRLELHDEAEEALGLEGWPQAVSVPAGAWAELPAGLRPTRRGRLAMRAVRCCVAGRLGLLSQVRVLPLLDELKVLPDFQAVARFALLAVDRRNAALGLHLRRRRGTGMEFHQLRDYREGDSLRQIDWNAVSRQDRLISRDYREESDQQVVLLLDLGRRMRALDGPFTHFDRVLDAALLLSFVALRQGDAVGALTWSGPERWLAPQKGAGAMNLLLDRVFDLQPTLQASDPHEAVRRLAARQRRRALVVLLTNLRDDDAIDLPVAFAPLRARHLVLVASLRERALDERVRRPAEDLEAALCAAATMDYLDERRRAHARLRQTGMHTLDVLPAELPAALVRRYLDFKRAGML